ncbi:MAG TPA: hypothetical protein VFX44_11435 [Solirubrobacterales bacterium]|nr:hypothetical protein [Solirubrobacterales bacterium]
MPRIIPFRLAAVCALAISLTLAFAAGAMAKGFSADLRVVGAGGKVLAEKTVSTADTSVKTSPKADCFGAGTGGSGKAVTIKGNTAMGLLAHAAKTTPALSPLLISDHFDFGIALCGIGSSVVKGKASWYLKVNHKSLQVGGDSAKIKPGDEVLWDLAPSYPYPDELGLEAPNTAKAGQPFKVKVVAYDEKGKAKPVAGVKVTGASAPTNAGGTTMVTLTKPAKLIAKASGEIPSALEPVCIGGKCPK